VPGVFTYLDIEGDGTNVSGFVTGLREALGDRGHVHVATDDLASPTPRWVRLNVDVHGADEPTTVETLRAAIGEADIDRALIVGPAFLSAV
jgi:hypothetical protein